MDEPLLVSIADVCQILGLSRTTIDKLINESQLQRVKIGRRALITRESIDTYIDKLKVQ